ncbi:MAG: hypothetical protein JXA71_19325 [Chitinispirillaceae bacterium]|nr:hypothetical protein [Chitinispirillaceae bacterium]
MQKLNVISTNSGSAIVGAVALGIILSIIGVGTLRLIGSGSELHNQDVEIVKSYWANEGAMRLAFRYISRVNNLPTTTTGDITDFGSAVTPSLSINGKNCTVSILVSPTNKYTYTYRSTIALPGIGKSSTIECNGSTVTNFSRYTRFTLQTSTAYWMSGTTYGDLHTNGYLKPAEMMDPGVHVTGKATTAGRVEPAQTYDRPNYPAPYHIGMQRENDNYNSTVPAGWFESRFPDYEHVGAIDVDVVQPTSPSFATCYAISPNTAMFDSTAIRLNGASISIYYRNKSTFAWSLQETRTIASISKHILKVNNLPTYVYGTIDEQLTIVTTNTTKGDIVLGGNILYQNTNLSSSNDALALVSAKNLYIPRRTNASSIGMVHDFNAAGASLYGSVFIPNGCITVDMDNFTEKRDLNVYGSILEKAAGGTFGWRWDGSKWIPRGIAGSYYQDPRFVNNSIVAPGIPSARAADEERIKQGYSTDRMWILNNGNWNNTVTTL